MFVSSNKIVVERISTRPEQNRIPYAHFEKRAKKYRGKQPLGLPTADHTAIHERIL
jgi:hypothetical protein